VARWLVQFQEHIGTVKSGLLKLSFCGVLAGCAGLPSPVSTPGGGQSSAVVGGRVYVRTDPGKVVAIEARP
jgi:hypothetical protein